MVAAHLHLFLDQATLVSVAPALIQFLPLKSEEQQAESNCSSSSMSAMDDAVNLGLDLSLFYSLHFKIFFESLDFVVDTNGELGLENHQSDSAVASFTTRSPSSSDLISVLAPQGFGKIDLPFGYDSKSVRSFDEDSIGSACLYPLTVNVVDIEENPSGDNEGEDDCEDGHEEDDRAKERVEEGHREENSQDNNLSEGHRRRSRGSRGSRLARRLDLGQLEIKVEGVKIYDTPQNNITGAKMLLDSCMADATYQTPVMQKAVAMLKAAAAQDAARDKSQSVASSSHATSCGNQFDLTRIKQKSDEPLRDYIKRFCTKKNEIPNVPDQQIIAAFQRGIYSDDLVREIDWRNHDLKLTARKCFEIADKFTSGESALDDICGKGKEKCLDKPESSRKDKKRKTDNMVVAVD
ncbi:hypothetical protein PR202_ga27572 [Eleusine coracana subsp. coracana]|uniref:Uncharacterized protein n=1 Tax=Eleusine coracana subsp. coracana TaxID=191504 RepID=A0AAV5DGB4_ELECO|nr:hypothetical protein PR202_ga27572 [Eleusine coracana subsp. coracana]